MFPQIVSAFLQISPWNHQWAQDPVAEAWGLLELSRLQLAEDPGQDAADEFRAHL